VKHKPQKTLKYSEKRRFGNLGEDIACAFLERKGFEIIERNYLRKWGEIDIIAKKQKSLHFVEVKTVSLDSPIRPEENMHGEKLKKLYRTIEIYTIENQGKSGELEWVLDAVLVRLDNINRKAWVKFLENIVS
jgi:putative endonuclease